MPAPPGGLRAEPALKCIANDQGSKYKNVEKSIWGYSSAGRALRSQCRGQGFEPPYLHQKNVKGIRQTPDPFAYETALSLWFSVTSPITFKLKLLLITHHYTVSLTTYSITYNLGHSNHDTLELFCFRMELFCFRITRAWFYTVERNAEENDGISCSFNSAT